MFQNLMFDVLVSNLLFLDGLFSEASDKINGLFTRGSLRNRLLEATPSRNYVSE